jgi:hypothetical protein
LRSGKQEKQEKQQQQTSRILFCQHTNASATLSLSFPATTIAAGSTHQLVFGFCAACKRAGAPMS